MENGGSGRVVTARLAGGAPVRVALSGVDDSGDGLTSVGLRDLDLGEALETVGQIGSAVIGTLRKARPTRATVELRLGFSMEAGKLTALWVGGHGEASMTVTLEWSAEQDKAGGEGGADPEGDGSGAGGDG